MKYLQIMQLKAGTATTIDNNNEWWEEQITIKSVLSQFTDKEKLIYTKLVETTTSLKHDAKKSMVNTTRGRNHN